MNQFKKSKYVVLLSGLVLLSMVLLTLSRQEWFKDNKLLSPIQSVVATGDQFLAKVTNSVSRSVSHIHQLLDAYKENQVLKQKVLTLSQVASENQTLREENKNLRESLGLSEAYLGYKQLVSEVLYRNPSSWSGTLAVNRGGESGVHQDMLAVSNGGVIGVVSEVTDKHTQIRLLTDGGKEHNLAVKINLSSGSVYGIITAYDMEGDVFVVTQLNSDLGLEQGQMVVTSDLSENLPSQLVVGTVAKVSKKKNGIETELRVKPAADFSNLYSVVLIGK